MKDLTEADWITKSGLRAVVNIMPKAGYRCGYVFIPSTIEQYVEPVYSMIKFAGVEREVMDYEEMYPDIYVHGGVTYGHQGNKEHPYPVAETREGVWLGFDAAHCDDAPDYDVWETLLEDEQDRLLFDTLKNMDDRFPVGMRTVRDQKYMAEECEILAKQIIEGTENE